MLYIDWFHVDWFTWLPFFLGLIVIVIFILRLVRLLTRWSPIEVSHVKEYSENIEGDIIRIYQRINPDQSSIKTTQNPYAILLIPPQSVKGAKKYHLAVALAATGRKIYVLTPQLITNWMQTNTFSLKLANLLKNQNITSGIVFDHLFSRIIKDISPADKMQWIFIRPQIPHTRAKEKIETNLEQNLSNQNPITTFQPVKCHFFIEPSTNWMNKTDKQNLKELKAKVQKLYPNNWITINSGGWSFFGQETVVFGYILGKISENSNCDH